MKLEKNVRLPVAIVCFTGIICILLLVLPVEQILTVYKVVNGVKTVEFVPKLKGIARILDVSILFAVIWILIRKVLDKKMPQNNERQDYRIIRSVIDVLFFAWTSLPSVMGIISIFLTFNG